MHTSPNLLWKSIFLVFLSGTSQLAAQVGPVTAPGGIQVPSIAGSRPQTGAVTPSNASQTGTSPASPAADDRTQRSTDDSTNNPDSNGKKTRDEKGTAARETRPVAPPTDFQLLVQATAGRILPIFGSELFNDVPSTFAPVEDVPVTPDYVVGPGDEVRLEVWGQASFHGRYPVDRSGNISLPEVGAVHVAGLPYDKLQGYIRAQLGRVYRNFDLNVNLGQLRSIQVFVLGNVTRPGSFTISSLSTLVNALFASGGPSPNGSLRRVQLKRASGFTQEFDLYDLLLHGDKSKDIPLLPGDVIFVPPVKSQVAIAGSVNSPAIYELKNENSLQEVLQLAGGLTVTAGPGGTRIERIDAHRDRSVVDVDLSTQGNQQVRPGDVLIVGAISDRFNNAVTLRGNVQNPGRYLWHPGMRVHDLIPDRESLLTRNYFRAHNQLGLINEADYAVSAEGRLQANSNGSGATPGGERAATTATTDSSDTKFTAKNDVVLSAADINWNYAVIERLNPVDLTTSLIPFSLGRVVLEGDQANNVELQAGDVITIFSKADIEVPASQRTRFVRLEGEFLAAGVYSVLPGETLRGLVKRAGGLSPDAYLFGSEFRRESTRKLQQQRLNEYIEQLQADSAQAAARVSQQGIQSTRTLAITPAQIDRLRGIRATGRIVLNLEPTSTGLEQIPDIDMEDGDHFIVPRVPSTVGVSGAVYNGSSFLYRPGARADKYLQMAGGPTREADKSREFIIRADGSIISRQYHSSFLNNSFKNTGLAPGDTIVVPSRTTINDPMRTILDIAQIVAQFGIGVAAINVLK